MPRLIDSSLEKLSIIMSDMGEMAVQCISLATDSYLQGSSSSDKVHALSETRNANIPRTIEGNSIKTSLKNRTDVQASFRQGSCQDIDSRHESALESPILLAST